MTKRVLDRIGMIATDKGIFLVEYSESPSAAEDFDIIDAEEVTRGVIATCAEYEKVKQAWARE